jgi:hypothetical protein
MSGESLQTLLAARRQELESRRAEKMVLAVPGYEKLLAVRCVQLPFEEKARIARSHSGLEDNESEEVAAAADLLIRACEDLLQVTGVDEAGKATYESLGKKWTSDSISELFGVDPQPTVRATLLSVLNSDQIVRMLADYHNQSEAINAEGDEVVQGEAVPSVEG